MSCHYPGRDMLTGEGGKERDRERRRGMRLPDELDRAIDTDPLTLNMLT